MAKAIVHQVFNSALVSGPETLVLPNLKGFEPKSRIVLLQETRLPAGATTVKNYAESLGHDVFELGVRSRLDFRAIRALSKFWKAAPPTIVHAHGVKASLYALLALRWSKTRSKLIVTHHGVRMNDTAGKLKLFETIFEKLVMPGANACLTVCTSDRELLAARGVAAAKLHVHLNGTDRELVPLNERQMRGAAIRKKWESELGILFGDAMVLGIVGRLSVEKRHTLVFEALSTALKEHPKFSLKLLLFGSGPLEGELKELVAKLELSEQILFLGYRPNVSAEMVGLDALLSLSLTEGLPINLIEAGWSATPVLATAVDGVRDLIEDGKSGRLIAADISVDDAARAIFEFCQNRSEASRLGAGLQARVREKFSSTAWRVRLSEIYSRFT